MTDFALRNSFFERLDRAGLFCATRTRSPKPKGFHPFVESQSTKLPVQRFSIRFSIRFSAILFVINGLGEKFRSSPRPPAYAYAGRQMQAREWQGRTGEPHELFLSFFYFFFIFQIDRIIKKSSASGSCGSAQRLSRWKPIKYWGFIHG